MATPLPPEYVEFLASGTGLTKMDDRLDYMVILLTKLLEQMGGSVAAEPTWITKFQNDMDSLSGAIFKLAGMLSTDPEGVLRNPPFIRAQVKRVPAAGTAVRLPDVKVPNGFYVAFKALRGNWGSIYLSNSKADAESQTTSYQLAPGEAIDLQISTIENIWIDADNDNEGLTWIVEQEATY